MGLFSIFFVQIVAFFSKILNLISKRDLKPSGRKFACGLRFGSYPTQNEPFWDLANPKCRASPCAVGSDTPSSWNLQFLFQKHDLLQKSENLHAALDSQVWKKSTFTLSTKFRSPVPPKCNFWEPLQAKKDWNFNSKEESDKIREKYEL